MPLNLEEFCYPPGLGSSVDVDCPEVGDENSTPGKGHAHPPLQDMGIGLALVVSWTCTGNRVCGEATGWVVSKAGLWAKGNGCRITGSNRIPELLPRSWGELRQETGQMEQGVGVGSVPWAARKRGRWNMDGKGRRMRRRKQARDGAPGMESLYEVRLQGLEIDLIGQSRLTLPPATYPWVRFDRLDEVQRRTQTLVGVRKERIKVQLRRKL